LSQSCIESYEDKEKRREQERQEQIKKWDNKINELLTPIKNRYNPKPFPSDDFKSKKIFTYNLKNYLIDKKNTPILFAGVLDDITKEEDQYIIHFSSLLSEYEIFDEKAVSFHLTCDYEDIETLIVNPPKEVMPDLLKWIDDPDFFVVCQVTDIQKIVYYKMQGHAKEKEDIEGDVRIWIETPYIYRIRGKLLELIKYPQE
jgi:hypothetical protein